MSTIKEIAQKAGVSPTTVANVLHGNLGKVSPATCKKVQTFIENEKYVPNMGAMILAHSNSRIIGVIMFMEPRSEETVLEDPFSSAMLGAMEREIRENGYFVMLHTTSDEDEVVRLSKAWKLDGLLLVWVPGEICRVISANIDTPLVYIDCYFTDNERVYHNIGLQDRRGGYEIARYLLSMGHTDIVFLANNQLVTGGDPVRFIGCQEAFGEQGQTLGAERYKPLPNNRGKREILYRQLAEDTSQCTALVFSADYYAAEAVSYLKECGIEIPGKISITGFDDNIFSRLVQPRLTTVHQDTGEKGRLAVAMLMKLIRKEPLQEINIQLPIRLAIRDSVQRLN
ncbi:transcriptional regulator [Sphaerochaeta pleomorpha str. Grapes]|uniref:Transcriptional regulator n=1 Tax=Sphaerochaeta pleomorpha (strain ATCC BAA-1885 / DSM 22778 / Grapes) TaxID=158190 RepID=G8QXB2_SPHPG|nr:LacI family DNA-binding transcriptional regulator [Sphaerochaeta pleomorpha]AEV28413.1 transcriptional regulator [Sphaerochaeta pleomorpha str. Grapes]